MWLWILAGAVGSFLLGAVPFGLIIARTAAGMDLRSTGSGNIGATNVARSLGMKFGLATLALDAAKGLIPVLAAYALLSQETPLGRFAPPLWGLAAFLGHVFSPFLGFRGGKGVATALGVFLGLVPVAVAPALAVFILVTALTGYVSAGSLSATVTIPVSAFLLGEPPGVYGMAVLIALVIIIRHYENIRRLISGRENRWRKKSPPPEERGG